MSFFDNIFDVGSMSSDYSIIGLNKEMSSLYIYDSFIKYNKGILVVASELYEANLLFEYLSKYTDKVLFFPMDDFLTSEAISVSPEFKAERIDTLNKLINDDKYIVVTNLMGYLRYLPLPSLWKDSNVNISVNCDYDRDSLLNKLYNMGYIRDVLVNETGNIGVRGYVIDIFPIMEENPVRIEFWGDTVTSIKYFDVDTQRSISEIDNICIYPFTEFLLDDYSIDFINSQKYLANYGSVASIYDYINDGICFFSDYNLILNSYSTLVDTIMDYDANYSADIKTNYMNSFTDIVIKHSVYIMNFDNVVNKSVKSLKFSINNIENYDNNYEKLKSDLLNYVKNNKTVIICVLDKNMASRISDYLEIDDIIYTDECNIINGKINLIIKSIPRGFIYGNYIVISDVDIFSLGNNVKKYKSKFKTGTRTSNILDINKGDFVVHEMFGIGIYDGLVTIPKNGMKKDYLKIIYADDDILYIPVENIDRISKFSGKDGVGVKLNSLSNDNWQKKKGKVKAKLESIADDLLKVSADRELKVGFAFKKDDENQKMFDSGFVYTETPDQIKSINDIKREMESSKPMDMLLCGDVGYGKTEVAFRAMFKAVDSGKQVAYLCPTTILSNQQYTSCIERFKDFPVRIELLNRFVDKSRQKKIIDDLEKGLVDIVFGTHRLLSNDVKYKDLGLLVIDEEQRFGVTHKEKIKQYKSTVDVLTLSATPIPRTLQMSMSGVRSLSLIETAPQERYPIQTYVLEENNLVIKDAIYKELSRNGQTFILYNNVNNIETKVNEFRSLVPEAKIDYAHGQMNKVTLENKMNNFINNKFNVLVCTTIIETGIDIPNVNTLIILDADRFGLSQLYQIRGRIGRSNKIGYAYLMYGKNKFLTDTAIKRLDVIREFTELGSGFKIAMRDLSIRGAGDILGREQSGFIDSIGIELYLKMLNEAVRKSKGEKIIEEDTKKNDKPLIEVSTHISDSYISDVELKILIHKKINEVKDETTLNDIRDELSDRFGKISEEMEIYMYEEWFEKIAKSLGINKVVTMKNNIDIELPCELSSKIDGERLFNDAYSISKMFRFLYKDSSIHIILDTIKLEKHFLIYLIELLEKIKGYKLNV
ncbi:transcription-repair coupling factor [Clostridium sp. CAG:914]|nr:transcription-repair coupling factor [Clostridium sp.]CDE95358.1 transcription-repair coupling factor [Clostridium sp. CAG:914]